MGILADHQIHQRCVNERMVTPYDPMLVGPASQDVRLGPLLLIESAESPKFVPYPFHKHSKEDPYRMAPGQFLLAQTAEKFNLPTDVCADFYLKSSRGREGLDTTLKELGLDHVKARFADPGWNGSVLTLELKNVRQLHPVLIWPGMLVGQLKYSRMDENPARSYAETGRYNGDDTVQQSKG